MRSIEFFLYFYNNSVIWITSRPWVVEDLRKLFSQGYLSKSRPQLMWQLTEVLVVFL